LYYWRRDVNSGDGNEVWVFKSKHGWERLFLVTPHMQWKQLTMDRKNGPERCQPSSSLPAKKRTRFEAGVDACLAMPQPKYTRAWRTEERVVGMCPVPKGDDGTQCCGAPVHFHPFCNGCLDKEYGVEVRASTIPGAGNGVFLTRDVRKGGVALPYGGELVTVLTNKRRYDPRWMRTEEDHPNAAVLPAARSYTLNVIGMNVFLDATHVRGIGSMINCSSAEFPPNVVFSQWSPAEQDRDLAAGYMLPEERCIVWLEFNQPLKAGTELLVDYRWKRKDF
jgi:hypothetical protein